MTAEARSTLVLRTLSILVMAPVFLVLVFLGGLPFLTVVAVAAVLSLYEWGRMARKSGAFVRGMVIGVAYLIVPFLSFIFLRLHYANGLDLIVALLLAVWASDIGGYLAGRVIGGPKWVPSISPNKTWAGLIGGMLLSAAVLFIFNTASQFSTAPIAVVAATGLMLGLVGQLGDLWVSMMKRRAGVKDTGCLIPGHGGVLDRIDSLILATPAFLVAYWVWL